MKSKLTFNVYRLRFLKKKSVGNRTSIVWQKFGLVQLSKFLNGFCCPRPTKSNLDCISILQDKRKEILSLQKGEKSNFSTVSVKVEKNLALHIPSKGTEGIGNLTLSWWKFKNKN